MKKNSFICNTRVSFFAFQANESFIPCASAIKDFTSCFLFSLETQHTIGYGVRWEKLAIQILKSYIQSMKVSFISKKNLAFRLSGFICNQIVCKVFYSGIEYRTRELPHKISISALGHLIFPT